MNNEFIYYSEGVSVMIDHNWFQRTLHEGITHCILVWNVVMIYFFVNNSFTEKLFLTNTV